MHDVADGQTSMGSAQGRRGAEEGQLEGQLLTPRRKGAKNECIAFRTGIAARSAQSHPCPFAPLRLRVKS
jgi:hypothetical protein